MDLLEAQGIGEYYSEVKSATVVDELILIDDSPNYDCLVEPSGLIWVYLCPEMS